MDIVDPKVAGQKFVLLSFIGPDARQKCDVLGLKVRGSYDSEDDARQAAKRLQTIDPNFDILIGKVGVWLPWAPDAQNVPDQVYQNETLDNMIRKHNEEIEKSKMFFEQRKAAMVAQARADGTKEGQARLAPTPEEAAARITHFKEQQQQLTEKLDELARLIQENEGYLQQVQNV